LALNPIIKFTTLFGLLAGRAGGVPPGMERGPSSGAHSRGVFLVAALIFVHRSF
jgi:hypothetical protein